MKYPVFVKDWVAWGCSCIQRPVTICCPESHVLEDWAGGSDKGVTVKAGIWHVTSSMERLSGLKIREQGPRKNSFSDLLPLEIQ
jgi:hypothetical protein